MVHRMGMVPGRRRSGEAKVPEPASGAGAGWVKAGAAAEVALALLAALLVVLLPALPAAAAESGTPDVTGGVLVRVDGDVRVATTESLGVLVVVEGDALVEGDVGAVVVVNGTATLTGATVGTVVVVDGGAVLRDGTVVSEDVVLANSTIKNDGSATVEGEVVEDLSAFSRIADVLDVIFNVVGLLFAIGGVLLTLLAATLFAGVAPGTLRAATSVIRKEPGGVALSGLVFWFVLPTVAFGILLTVVGAPTALAIWFVAMPAVAAAGYLVTGFWIGGSLLAHGTARGHPYAPTLLGTAILLGAGLIPLLGALVTFAASLVGGSALVLLAWKAVRSGGPGDDAPVPPPQPAVTPSPLRPPETRQR